MTPKRIKELIADHNPDALFADGLDDALIGSIETFHGRYVALYDIQKCIYAIMQDGVNYEDAEEYFSYNTLGAYIGENGPLFANIERKPKYHSKKPRKSKNNGEELFVF